MDHSPDPYSPYGVRTEGEPGASTAACRYDRPARPTILGVTPLLFATGAGAAGQRAIGTVVFGGMIASTLLAIPFVPVFYLITQRLSERFSR